MGFGGHTLVVGHAMINRTTGDAVEAVNALPYRAGHFDFSYNSDLPRPPFRENQ